MSSLLWNDLHYILDGKGHEYLFDISRDPEEKQNLAARPEEAERLQWFRDELKRITGGRSSG